MMRAALASSIALALAACASAPEQIPDGPRVPLATTRPVIVLPSPDPGIGAFEQRQRDAARHAAQQGRWVDAIWAWDVVLALRPNDAAARAERDAAQSTASTLAADRLSKARQARQRGDAESAIKLYLEVLAVAPDDQMAADALRDIERARARRGSLSAARTAQIAQRAAAGGDRNELEHASMLATQGELDAAIALLIPQASDPRARAMLADVYWRQAVRLESKDRVAAIASLRRCLQFDPGHKLAAEKLKALIAAATAG
jgi:tetratricopeptide (TPR) repeat protein